MSNFYWPVKQAFVVTRTAKSDEIDKFGHVNNSVYARWVNDATWEFLNHIGAGFERFAELGQGFVVREHKFQYLKPILPGNQLLLGVWTAENDLRLRIKTKTEFRFAHTGALCFESTTTLVAIDMKTQRATRMHPHFKAVCTPAEPL